MLPCAPIRNIQWTIAGQDPAIDENNVNVGKKGKWICNLQDSMHIVKDAVHNISKKTGKFPRIYVQPRLVSLSLKLERYQMSFTYSCSGHLNFSSSTSERVGKEASRIIRNQPSAAESY